MTAQFYWNDRKWIERTTRECDALDRAAHQIVWDTTKFELNRKHFASCMTALPRGLHGAAAALYRREYDRGGETAANDAALDLRDAFRLRGLPLDANDSDIRDFAEERARAVSRMLSDRSQIGSGEEVMVKLERYCQYYGIDAPEAKTLAPRIARALCPRWWRRRLRAGIIREIEHQAIKLGLVHRRASIYASAEATARRKQQLRRNARILAATSAENEDGQVFTLAELASVNMANPAIRRAELMTRMAGFEEHAKAVGDVGMFYTITCPSKMHARLSASGAPNPRYDGTSPRSAQDYLVRQWSRMRAAIAREQVVPYGIRVVEPHHDATPHWHMLLFVPPQMEPIVTAIIRKYASECDAGELSSDAAREARFKAIRIDQAKGSACGYIAKYIGKNIAHANSGLDYEAEPGVEIESTVTGVEAWAATWGIRQFQQLGGPPVGVWRELRRLRVSQDLPLFEQAWLAADSGNWRGYIRHQNGIYALRRDRHVHLWRDGARRLSRYGDDVPPPIAGVTRMLECCVTRFQEWRIGGKSPPDGVPWTRVNNCTRQ